MSTSILGQQGSGAGGDAGAGNPGSAPSGATGGSAATGGTGSAPPATSSWRDSLPDELKSNPMLQQFSDVTNLAKSFVATKEMVGKKGVIVPGEKASDEEWQAFYKSVGQPEADKFEIKAPENAGLKPEFLTKFKEMAHKSGLMPKQAQALLEGYMGLEKEAQTAQLAAKQAAFQEGLSNLQKEWGQGFDKEVGKARAAAKEFGGEAFVEYLNKSGLGNDPFIIKTLAKAGAMLGEDALRGDGSGTMGGMTPLEIERKIADVFGNKDHPYFHRSHPGHKVAMADMEALFKLKAQSSKQA